VFYGTYDYLLYFLTFVRGCGDRGGQKQHRHRGEKHLGGARETRRERCLRKRKRLFEALVESKLLIRGVRASCVAGKSTSQSRQGQISGTNGENICIMIPQSATLPLKVIQKSPDSHKHHTGRTSFGVWATLCVNDRIKSSIYWIGLNDIFIDVLGSLLKFNKLETLNGNFCFSIFSRVKKWT